jgi:hypothetical protein
MLENKTVVLHNSFTRSRNNCITWILYSFLFVKSYFKGHAGVPLNKNKLLVQITPGYQGRFFGSYPVECCTDSRGLFEKTTVLKVKSPLFSTTGVV